MGDLTAAQSADKFGDEDEGAKGAEGQNCGQTLETQATKKLETN